MQGLNIFQIGMFTKKKFILNQLCVCVCTTWSCREMSRDMKLFDTKNTCETNFTIECLINLSPALLKQSLSDRNSFMHLLLAYSWKISLKKCMIETALVKVKITQVNSCIIRLNRIVLFETSYNTHTLVLTLWGTSETFTIYRIRMIPTHLLAYSWAGRYLYRLEMH